MKGMNKLSFGQIEAKQNIKDDAMRPTLCLVSIILFFIVLILLFCQDNIIKYSLLVLFFITVFAAIYINMLFAHKDRDRLQTERYLLNKQMIEAGIIENKTNNILSDIQETDKTKEIGYIPLQDNEQEETI